MLAILWVLTGVAVLAALAAFVKARRLGKRLERLTESYWELRYELAQARARLNRLDPEQQAAEPEAPPQAGTTGATAFVPLSSLRRPD